MARPSTGVIERIWPLPLENNTCVAKEIIKSDKNQIQVGHVNAFKPGHTEEGLLLQVRKKKDIKEQESSNNVPKIKVIIIQCT